jgi:phage terminase small subunit
VKLTPKQKKFADLYIKSGNASESAVKAGYSKAYATTHVYKMLENARVKSYISSFVGVLTNERYFFIYPYPLK